MEDHYGRPMGIEWAKDGESAEPFIFAGPTRNKHNIV